MQTVHIQINHDHFFCPATGQNLLDDLEEFIPSSATVFCYRDDVGEFEYIDDNAKIIFNNLNIDDDDSADEIFSKFEAAYTDNNIVCFTITKFGMPGEPDSITVRIGIQMNHDKDAQK
jgi:hypothetical protein